MKMPSPVAFQFDCPACGNTAVAVADVTLRGGKRSRHMRLTLGNARFVIDTHADLSPDCPLVQQLREAGEL